VSHTRHFYRFRNLYDSNARIASLTQRAAAGGQIRHIQISIGEDKMFFGQRSAAHRHCVHAGLIANTLLLAISAANCAYADSNILPNGDFSNAKQISGWTGDPAGSISFNAFDFDGSTDSEAW
jgi:hypothetical protein